MNNFCGNCYFGDVCSEVDKRCTSHCVFYSPLNQNDYYEEKRLMAYVERERKEYKKVWKKYVSEYD